VAKRLLGAVALAAALCIAAAPLSVAPWQLVQEKNDNNPSSPPGCLNEDDTHWREWQGSFSGTWDVSEYFCTPGVDTFEGLSHWDGGGTGLTVDLTFVGSLDHLTLSTDGRTGYYGPQLVSAVQIDQWTVGHGKNRKTYQRYRACVYPSDIGSTFAGTWSISMAGTFSEADYWVQAQMESFDGFPNNPCP
jgi:hypothetical protein